MTNVDQQPTPVDYQRAAALISHRADASVEGMRYIAGEASQAGRTTALLIATIAAYLHIIGELRTESARTAIDEYLAISAGQHIALDARRAAIAAIAVRDGDTEAFNAVTAEANARGRAAHLAGAVLDLFSGLLPELGTPTGLRSLTAWCAGWSALGDSGDV